MDSFQYFQDFGCKISERKSIIHIKMLYFVFFPHLLPGGDAGEKVWWLLCKSQSSEDHSDSLQTVSHEQEL